MIWHTAGETAKRLRQPVEQVYLLCVTGQIAWRPKNPQSRRVQYLISEEAIQDYERATTVQAKTRPLRRTG